MKFSRKNSAISSFGMTFSTRARLPPQVTRPTWTEGAASANSITNSATVNFDITGAGTVKGVFLAGGTNAQTKGDHTAGASHKLWATALFSGGDVVVANGDQLKVTYTVSD